MSFIMLLFVGGALLGTGALVFGGIFVLVSSKKKRLGAALLAVGLLMGVCQACVFLWSLKPMQPNRPASAPSSPFISGEEPYASELLIEDELIQPIREEPSPPGTTQPSQ